MKGNEREGEGEGEGGRGGEGGCESRGKSEQVNATRDAYSGS